MSLPELSQHFSEHQLPITLGGKFHPHTDPSPQPLSPGHAPRPKLPRQQSHPEQLNEVVRGGGEQRALDRINRLNPVTSPDHRTRSHSGSAADRAHLRPLHPMLPPSGKAPPAASHRGKSPPLPATTTSEPVDSKPRGEGVGAALCQKTKLQKLRNMFQGKAEEDDPSFSAPLKPPQVVTAGAAARRTPPPSSAHSTTSENCSEPHLSRSKATPTVKIGGGGVASRIRNFEQVKTADGGGRGFDKRSDNEGGGANRHHGRGGRALVPVQIGSEGEKRSREEEGRRRREEEMRRRRAEEDRIQRERRAKDEPITKILEDDYENVDLGPPSSGKTDTPSSKRAEVKGQRAAETGRDNSTAYENVPLNFPNKGQRSPDPSKQNRGNTHVKHSRAHKVGVAGGPAPKKHQYENITILTEAGPVPYHLDSSEDSDDSSGDESPADPQEVIYENYGVDSGNQQMGIEEIERYLAAKEKRGISAEYLRIKNEPLAHPYTACRSVEGE